MNMSIRGMFGQESELRPSTDSKSQRPANLYYRGRNSLSVYIERIAVLDSHTMSNRFSTVGASLEELVIQGVLDSTTHTPCLKSKSSQALAQILIAVPSISAIFTW